jgi:hypothetical protein
MKKFGIILFITAVITVIFIFPSDKKRIRKAIGAAEQAVVNEDVKALMDRVSFNYADDYGGSYLTLKKRAEHLFKAYDDFEVTAEIAGIAVIEEKATVDVKVSLVASSGSDRGYLIGEAGGHREIKVYFEKSKLNWMITGLEAKQSEL